MPKSAVVTALVSSSLAASEAKEVRVAIMSDCKGAFGANYENDIGGAQAAFAQYAGGKPANKQKPSAGMSGIKVGGTSVKIVGYGCGDDTPATGLRETRRLVQGVRTHERTPTSSRRTEVVPDWADSAAARMLSTIL